jgi:hypothetical protein
VDGIVWMIRVAPDGLWEWVCRQNSDFLGTATGFPDYEDCVKSAKKKGWPYDWVVNETTPSE